MLILQLSIVTHRLVIVRVYQLNDNWNRIAQDSFIAKLNITKSIADKDPEANVSDLLAIELSKQIDLACVFIDGNHIVDIVDYFEQTLVQSGA